MNIQTYQLSPQIILLNTHLKSKTIQGGATDLIVWSHVFLDSLGFYCLGLNSLCVYGHMCFWIAWVFIALDLIVFVCMVTCVSG